MTQPAISVEQLKPDAPKKAPRVKNAPLSPWARRRERLAWVLVLPSLLVVLLIAFFPLLNAIFQSFTNQRFGKDDFEFVGLRNYIQILDGSSPIVGTDFQRAIVNTLVLSVITVIMETLLGLVVALVINSNFKGRGLMRTAMLIPWAIPTVVSARMWAFMYNDIFGVLNDLLVDKLHILSEKIAWIANPATALPAICAVDIWKTTPFMALLLLAGLQVIPTDMYEAATVDGASKVQQFFWLTLPLLMPALLVALIFRTLAALRVFDVIFVMKGLASETNSMAILARSTLVDNGRIGLGAAMSVLIFVIIAIFVIGYTRLVRVEES